MEGGLGGVGGVVSGVGVIGLYKQGKNRTSPCCVTRSRNVVISGQYDTPNIASLHGHCLVLLSSLLLNHYYAKTNTNDNVACNPLRSSKHSTSWHKGISLSITPSPSPAEHDASSPHHHVTFSPRNEARHLSNVFITAIRHPPCLSSMTQTNPFSPKLSQLRSP